MLIILGTKLTIQNFLSVHHHACILKGGVLVEELERLRQKKAGSDS